VTVKIEQRGDTFVGHFKAMASPCEILIETTDKKLAGEIIHLGAAEAWRIETKYSRYRTDNIIHRINTAHGQSITVDDETASLLDFASDCYQLSDGLFDITSGVLRRVWNFDGGDSLPPSADVEALLELVGWGKLHWENPVLTLAENMQLDFGGIGKEYAVDKVLVMLQQQTEQPVLVNLGGDLHTSGCRAGQKPWITGIENPLNPGGAYNTLQLYQGALATSGDVFRYLEKDGVRYSHILNPITGWPVANAPHSVTVAAENCTEAGILATLAMLQGDQAEAFLESQQVKHWIYH